MTPKQNSWSSSFEENVYLLCKQLCTNRSTEPDLSDLFVVFISNENMQVPIWQQRAGLIADGLVVWDYHVICIQEARDDMEARVWDLDTLLPFPVTFREYVEQSFHPSLSLARDLQRLFRVVAASVFIRCFASDRRHMQNADGTWKAPPPRYDCIIAEDGTVHNLESFTSISDMMVTMDAATVREYTEYKFGVVLEQKGFENFFTSRFSNHE
eukprot:c21883_g1_i2 orf=687-1322(+)